MHRLTLLKLSIGLMLSVCTLSALGQTASTQEQITKGEYLARAADCAACHTAPNGGKAFAGGYPISSPLGTIYSSNITPSKSAGIGDWSEQQFARAVREGVSANGRHLYPAMPYTAYASITDADMQSLYAYFTQAVQPVDATVPETHLPFPYSVRASMIGWNLLYLHNQQFQPDVSQSDKINRGRYLVDALGHCSSCHSPRTLFMSEDSSRYLAGGEVAGWIAPNITSDPISGIGGWPEAELAQFLKTGHVAGKAQASGGMAEAVQNSLRYLTDSDLQAIAAYLKTVPPKTNPGQTQAAYSYGTDTGRNYDFDSAQSALTLRAASKATPIGAALLASRTYTEAPKVSDGARLFVDACASCHQPNGSGTADHYYPSLFHNSTVGASTANNLIMAILHGVNRHGSDGATFMPGFANDMTDAQIAAVASYVAQRFGNPQLSVTPEDVELLRHGGPKPALQEAMPWLLFAGAVIALLILYAVYRLLRRKARH